MVKQDSAFQRHAIFYWKLLVELNEMLSTDTRQALAELDQNWAQILYAHQWAVEHIVEHEVARILVSAYARMGTNLIEYRLSPVDEYDWYRAAKQSAELQQDLPLLSTHLNDLGAIAVRLGHYQEATQYFQEALKLAIELQQHSEQSRAAAGAAQLYALTGEQDKALSLYRFALEKAQEADSETLQSRILGYWGLLLLEMERYDEAIALLEEAYKITNTHQDSYKSLMELGSLGTAYIAKGDHEAGIRVLHKSLALAQEIGDKAEEARSLGSLGVAYRNVRQLDDAIDALKKAVDLAIFIGDPLSEGKRLVNLALVYAWKEDAENTLACLYRARAIFMELSLSHLITTTDSYISTVLGNLNSSLNPLE